MTFICEIELDSVKYKCEYTFWSQQFKFNPKPDDETEQRLIPRVYELMHEYFWAIEEDCSRHDKPSEHECSWHVYGPEAKPFDHLETERQSFVKHQEPEISAKGINLVLYKGLFNNEKIGCEYDCRFDAMQAAKEHAARFGKQQIYGLFENGLNTHIIKTNGIYVELTEIPVHKQTRLGKE